MLVIQLCPTLCDPIDCSLPGSTDYGILQARILVWVAFPFLGDQTQIFCVADRFFTIWGTRKDQTSQS